MRSLSIHGAEAQPLLELVHWLQTSGRTRVIPQYEDDPDIVQAMLWKAEGVDDPHHAPNGTALGKLVIRPGPAADLGYWMACMPEEASHRISSLGHDGGQGTLRGLAAWTPPNAACRIIHLSARNAFGSVIGTPNEFLRALSVPIASLAEVLETGASEPAAPNEDYRAWLQSTGRQPAETIEDALPALRPPDDDPFREWLRDIGYADRHFMGST